MLDCCDLSVLKVEEVDVATVPGIEKFTRSPKLTVVSELRNQILRELVTACKSSEGAVRLLCSLQPGSWLWGTPV